jgi:hypothetical protein
LSALWLNERYMLKMDTWYTKELGDGIMASTPAEEIRQAFQRAVQSEGALPEMAVFTRLESEGRLHCERIVYFSPAARELALAFEAQPCAKPTRAGLGLLAGPQESWALLFPESAG